MLLLPDTRGGGNGIVDVHIESMCNVVTCISISRHPVPIFSYCTAVWARALGLYHTSLLRDTLGWVRERHIIKARTVRKYLRWELIMVLDFPPLLCFSCHVLFNVSYFGVR